MYSSCVEQMTATPNDEQIVQELHARVQSAPYAVAEQAGLYLSRAGWTEKERRRLLHAFARAALQIVAIEDAGSLPNPLDYLFTPSLQFWQKERIAVLLLHLFCVYGDLASVQEIMSRAPALFDEVLKIISTELLISTLENNHTQRSTD